MSQQSELSADLQWSMHLQSNLKNILQELKTILERQQTTKKETTQNETSETSRR